MTDGTRIELTSVDDGRAVLQIAYAGRYARLELDRIDSGAGGATLAQRVEAELDRLLDALREWRKEPGRRLGTRPGGSE